MKKIKEIQEENRNTIKECLMLHCDKASFWTDENLDIYRELSLNDQQQSLSFCQKKIKEVYNKTFGKSELLTLNRLLIALEEKSRYLCIDTDGNICSSFDTDFAIVRWDLGKDTLEDQEQSVQRKIHELLIGDKNDK